LDALKMQIWNLFFGIWEVRYGFLCYRQASPFTIRGCFQFMEDRWAFAHLLMDISKWWNLGEILLKNINCNHSRAAHVLSTFARTGQYTDWCLATLVARLCFAAYFSLTVNLYLSNKCRIPFQTEWLIDARIMQLHFLHAVTLIPGDRTLFILQNQGS
jgi:hypothetical protein